MLLHCFRYQRTKVWIQPVEDFSWINYSVNCSLFDINCTCLPMYVTTYLPLYVPTYQITLFVNTYVEYQSEGFKRTCITEKINNSNVISKETDTFQLKTPRLWRGLQFCLLVQNFSIKFWSFITKILTYKMPNCHQNKFFKRFEPRRSLLFDQHVYAANQH